MTYEQASIEPVQPANQSPSRALLNDTLPPMDLGSTPGGTKPDADKVSTPAPQLDAHEAKLSAAPSNDTKSLQRIDDEIAVSGWDAKAAKYLDSGNVDGAARLFQDAYDSWGAVGVREMANRVSQFDQKGTGLDLKFKNENPQDGKLLSNLEIVESRSAVGSFIAGVMGWSDNTMQNTSLHKVVDRADKDWHQQVEKERAQQIDKDVTRLEKMFKSGQKQDVADELLAILNHDYPYSFLNELTNRNTVADIRGYEKTPEYGQMMMSELAKRIPASEFNDYMPYQVWNSKATETALDPHAGRTMYWTAQRSMYSDHSSLSSGQILSDPVDSMNPASQTQADQSKKGTINPFIIK